MGQNFNLGLALIGLLGTEPRVLKLLRSGGTEFALQTVRSLRGLSEQKLKDVIYFFRGHEAKSSWCSSRAGSDAK